MRMTFLVLTVALPATVSVYLYYRLTKTKEALFAARRQAAHAQARHEGARRAAHVAEKRCTQVLGQMEQALAQTGEALEIAGHIKLVSQQIHGLIEYIADPLDAPAPLQHEPGRHALPGPGRHALPSSEALNSEPTEYLP
jgi:hypothetical protein